MKKWLLTCALTASIGILSAQGDPLSLYNAGRYEQESENWYGAIESYQEALRVNPSYVQAWQGLAESFYALGEYEQALTSVLKAEELRKNDPALLDLRAFIYIGLGKTSDASSVFKKVLDIWPNDVSARFGLAEIEIAAGRLSSASSLYAEALSRYPESRKALLSLAVLSREAGNQTLARDYINRAMRLYGDSYEVYYFAAHLAFLNGQNGEAEGYILKSLELKGDHDDSHILLGQIMYRQGRYQELILLCEQRIQKRRNNPDMWYLRTLALEKSGRFEEAIRSAQSALEISPSDEVLRSIMENIMIATLAFEDSRRIPASSFHAQRGREFESKNMSDQAIYEYRRALKINPYDVESRQSYAKILLSRGLPGRQVEQLEFIQSLGKSTTRVNDAIESYKKLLVDSVPNKWKIDVLSLDKVHTKIGLFYTADPSAIRHPDGERIAAAMVAEVFGYHPRFDVISSQNPSASYSEAFRKSRERGDDYFILLKLKENDRDIQIIADMYVSKTGSAAKTFTVFRTGNDRFSNAVRRLVQTITNDMPIQGRIVKRFQGDGVINLGKADGIAKDQVFDILPTGDVGVANEGISLSWKPESLLGTFTITQLDEDVSAGKIERSGFYDRINPGDAVLLRKKEAQPLPAEPGEKVGSVSPVLNLIRKIR